MTRVAAVVLAGGSGTRMGADRNKVLLDLAGIAVLAHSVRTVLELEEVCRLVIVVRPDDRDDVSAALTPHLGSHDAWIVDGGAERHDSEWHALRALAHDIDAGEIDVVAIHDGARPLATADLWRRVIAAAGEHGGALPVVPAGALLSRDAGSASPAQELVAVQTPQAFAATALLRAYESANDDGFRGTDTAACVAAYSDAVVVGVDSEVTNIKVTFAEDLPVAEALLNSARG